MTKPLRHLVLILGDQLNLDASALATNALAVVGRLLRLLIPQTCVALASWLIFSRS